VGVSQRERVCVGVKHEAEWKECDLNAAISKKSPIGAGNLFISSSEEGRTYVRRYIVCRSGKFICLDTPHLVTFGHTYLHKYIWIMKHAYINQLDMRRICCDLTPRGTARRDGGKKGMYSHCSSSRSAPEEDINRDCGESQVRSPLGSQQPQLGFT
jgi:hypothetical protein